MSKLATELKLQITYDVFGDTLPDEIVSILRNAGEYLRDNGLLTQEADVMIDDCVINAKISEED